MSFALLWYELRNLGSYGEDGGFIDLRTTAKDSKTQLWADVHGQKVNLITAIMGANASGKTTLLKPLSFLTWLFWSIPAKLSDQLYLNINRTTPEPGLVKVGFVFNGKVYTYEIEAWEGFIANERLFVKGNNNKDTYIFKREMDPVLSFQGMSEDELVINNDKDAEKILKLVKYNYVEKKDLFPFGGVEAKRTPANTSIMSAARRIGVTLAANIAEAIRCTTNVSAAGRLLYSDQIMANACEFLYENRDVFLQLKKIIRGWDLGLSDITIELKKEQDSNGREEEYYVLYGIHEREDGETYDLPFTLESAGTRSAFLRLQQILQSLQEGKTCFIDELGDDLHPHMVKPILELFAGRDTNPHCAQLVFTCHKPELINYLGKYRVIICEKKYNKSECFRLDEFPSSEARVDDNLAAKYLAGTFGGVPDL
ncbi:TPA: ATP-binding protein [Citrobacter amalonaticus]|uniref:AAA family ATPase n=1 Tax=Citrobacter amalonaticus TaxID=35703 RepID=UPI000A3A88FA|nr:ATP-binding protein [Citrobacter amalonaticus]OUE60033.1 hypothetical protein AZ012_004325 [Citrobacter amalonaticus]HEM6698753.1 ATP-binding protein [Citrobacter amalonaticus]HEM8516515.1 ATP-binding protein [Citrobacter amalonaticus]